MSSPPRSGFLFAPGAGAPSTHPWIQRWATLLRTLGRVETFDYPYMLEQRGRPDPLPTLIAAHTAALRRFERRANDPVVLVGKSMGSRVGCHVSLREPVSAVICFGYPLCGAGDPSKLRDKVLREMTTPVLFIQGTRDKLCPLELLEPILTEMKATTDLHRIEDGDHSLLVTKRWLKARGETQAQVDERIMMKIAQFLAHAQKADH